MDIRFAPHNIHHENPQEFLSMDPHLRVLARQPLVFRSPMLDRFNAFVPGIYTITGGRQIGKTTLLKQWMAELLGRGIPAGDIVFVTGELVEDHHSLIRLLMDIAKELPGKRPGYIIVDEVTYIREWDRGIKYLADAGVLEDVVLVLTGSDAVIIREARMRFPGRRGPADQVDFHLQPLTFLETVELKRRISMSELDRPADDRSGASAAMLDVLYEEFEFYRIHGGYLTAINDIAAGSRIIPATLATYSDWIRGDVLKRGRQEHYLRQVLEALVKHHGSQITWNTLTGELSIDHPKTIADYVALLESMDVVFIQYPLVEDKLGPSPKKARKVLFTDPFIFHAARAWLKPVQDPFGEQIHPSLSDPHCSSRLAESIAAGHFRRFYPTYYIKAKGEIDIAYVTEGRFFPVEIKWTSQTRPKDLQQAVKYPNSRILTKSRQTDPIMGIPTEPLPLALIRLCMENRSR